MSESEKIFTKACIIVILGLGFMIFTYLLFLPLLRLLVPMPSIETYDPGFMIMVPITIGVISFLYLMCESILKGPAKFSESKATGRSPANTTLTCKHGHTVPVWFNYDGKYIYGSSNISDRFSKANVWPKRCPICGARWRIPELEND